jgi:thiosulfate/3-mercaptopyruvate sulfurtransferase
MKTLLISLILLMTFSSQAFASIGTDTWFISPRQAKTHLPRSTVLDVRSASAFGMGHIPGSVRVSWQQFSKPSGPEHGELLEPEALQEAIRKVGVSNQIPVVVIGDANEGWGEEGRIVWMLRALGHKHVAMVDGGIKALKRAKFGTRMGTSATPQPGNFTIEVDQSLVASHDDVKKAMKAARTILVDTREAREFSGKTPYGEKRGGHVPGAKHLYFKELMDKNGMILPREEIEKKLDALGITTTTPVIAYCTGGIRSAWLVAVLQHYKFKASNYPGSMWHWASMPAEEFPLQSAQN